MELGFADGGWHLDMHPRSLVRLDSKRQKAKATSLAALPFLVEIGNGLVEIRSCPDLTHAVTPV